MKVNKVNNTIIKDYGDWVEVDISTKMFPNYIMQVDKDIYEMIQNDNRYGKIFPCRGRSNKSYLYAGVNMKTGKRTKSGKIEYKMRRVHQLVYPDYKMIDHINLIGDKTGLDNRRSNLRETTHAENILNSHRYL